MAKRLETTASREVENSAQVRAAIQEAKGRPRRGSIECNHMPPARFIPGNDLTIALAVKNPPKVSVRLYYRHVNQSEHYESVEIQKHGGEFAGTIPAKYTDSQYPLQYYFELKQGQEKAWLYPGLNPQLTSQPYFLVRAAKS
jgi:hypothetical protein